MLVFVPQLFAILVLACVFFASLLAMLWIPVAMRRIVSYATDWLRRA